MKQCVAGPLAAASLLFVCGAPLAQDPAGVQARLSEATAQALVDSLLGEVVALRGLQPKRELTIHVAAREWVRTRLEEIIVADNIEPRAREEERVLRYLGLIPSDVDLIELYKDLIEEQLAGMYDIDERVLVLANWLPTELQTPVVTHELVHALQDQHFSLRVRKKLGFETPDAEAAWQALMEGDATAAMLQTSFQALGHAWIQVLDSLESPDWESTLEDGGGGVQSQKLLAAPRVIRDALGFPYQSGLSFVAALIREGGWKRVDEAYLHPPVSTEQILHPERFLQQQDMPIRVDVPDLRGVLGAGYAPSANMALGEYDLFLYLNQYRDTEIAKVGADGWGGAWISLYAAPEGDPDALVLATVWDTKEDAYEFFGSIIGALEKRYPNASGDLEATSGERIVWNVDPEGRYQNILRLANRRVQILEQIPVAVTDRAIQKLDRMTKYDDPSPTLRADAKAQLPWRKARRVAPSDSVLTLQVPALPRGWHRDPALEPAAPPGAEPDTVSGAESVPVPAANNREGLLFSARRKSAKLEVMIDREAQDRLGISGYAHALASQIQKDGSNVYIHEPAGVKRDDLAIYEHVFSQTQDGRTVVYYIAVADLGRGYGYVVMSQPDDGETPSVAGDFDELLRTLTPVPWTPPPAKIDAESGAKSESGGDADTPDTGAAPRSQRRGG